MLTYNLLFILFFHLIAQKIIIIKYDNNYLKDNPLLLHSVIYSFILFFPSLFLFNDPKLSWYFICTLCLVHHSITYLSFSINNYITKKYETILFEFNNYFLISSLFLIFTVYYNV